MNKKQEIPPPAHPYKRRDPLPWQQPKATEEDPEALQRVQAILNNPSYRRADNDIDFLAQDGVRGVRLQIDYLKPELLLEEHKIHQTIVVFGSTRICEPAAALRKVDTLRASLEHIPPAPRVWRVVAADAPGARPGRGRRRRREGGVGGGGCFCLGWGGEGGGGA